MWRGIWALFLVLFGWGCAKSDYARSYPSRESYADGGARYKMAREEAEAAYPASTASADEGSFRGDKMMPAPEEKPAKSPPAPGGGPSADIPPVPGKGESKKPSVARMIIYAARLAIEVVEPEKSLEAALETMRKMGGFLAQRDDYMVEIRIPAALFFDFVREMEKLGTVTDRVIASEDVTEMYADLALRLENLQAMRSRLMALLEQAQRVEDRLAIERELSRINEEIEVIAGRMRMLKNLADYATVFLRFTPRYAGGPPQPQKQPTPVWWVRGVDISNLFGGQRGF